jgi:hypothetical protein
VKNLTKTRPFFALAALALRAALTYRTWIAASG